MRTWPLLVTLSSVLLFNQFAEANTWYIEPDGTGDWPTIQLALDNAADGDTVMLAPGTFNEEASWSGKEIFLIGSGQTSTLVQGSGGDVIMGVNATGCVADLTVTGGNSGIKFINSIASVRDCEAFGNSTKGVYYDAGGANLLRAIAHDNGDDGVTLAQVDSATVVECEIYHNGSHGIMFGAVGSVRSKNLFATRCTIYENTDTGLYLNFIDGAVIEQCLFYGNRLA